MHFLESKKGQFQTLPVKEQTRNLAQIFVWKAPTTRLLGRNRFILIYFWPSLFWRIYFRIVLKSRAIREVVLDSTASRMPTEITWPLSRRTILRMTQTCLIFLESQASLSCVRTHRHIQIRLRVQEHTFLRAQCSPEIKLEFSLNDPI